MWRREVAVEDRVVAFVNNACQLIWTGESTRILSAEHLALAKEFAESC